MASDTALPRANRAVLLALFLAAGVLRIIWLAEFPHVEADEGLWTNCSKNFVMYGDWFMDERMHVLLSPVFHALSVAVFTLVGPSIAAARAISAVAGALAVVFMYILMLRVTRRPMAALGAALFLGFNHWFVAVSRKAMIEPLQVCLILGSVVLLVGPRRWWRLPVAGALFGLVLLTKINAAIVLLALGTALLLPIEAGESWWRPRRLGDAMVYVAVAVGGAALVYGALYLATPDRFMAAFRVELQAARFAQVSHPIIHFGRFGLDPVYASNNMLDLFRLTPFVMVLGLVGLAVGAVTRPRYWQWFGVWMVLTMGFFFLQLFQPLRYFLLAMPALVVLATFAVDRLAGTADTDVRTHRWLWGAVLVVYLAFNISRTVTSLSVNRDHRLRTIVEWVETETAPTDRLMAAGYFCTDLPRRAYGYYYIARTPDELLESVRTCDIDYVIYDVAEWPDDLRDTLAAQFEQVIAWPFGAVYRVPPADESGV